MHATRCNQTRPQARPNEGETNENHASCRSRRPEPCGIYGRLCRQCDGRRHSFFTELPGVVAQADVPNASAYAQNRQVQPQQAQNGQGVHVYVSRSNQGTWLFAPNGNQGANS